VEIIGHKKQREILKKIVSLNEVSHAILFSGPEKIGKKTIAFNLISSLFGEKDISSHPDFILIEPQEKQIQINQIRDLSWRLSLRPMKAPLLGVVIDEAHSMTREAQNCFLKTLEEPKSQSILLLISNHPNLLLPTILSRCENIKFYPVRREEIRKYLNKKISKEETEEILNFSLGRPGLAIEMLRNPDRIKSTKKKIKELIEILHSPLSLRFKYAKELSEDKNLKETLKIWLIHFRDKLVCCRDKMNLTRIKNILNEIQETIFLISTTNVNPKLALEILMMKL